ncbi:hypothetical protein PCCS19_58570 [Paenibacillus sp. CCS19]|uniref:hypothetical protein n=1 Tax=Paenibacillus sp. CCS19 TaxID=3158387 RepID=UPI00255E54F5|nr:hypothetical protein [Paenibacillus cellulosilyticus]GMK42797.1 hypothetical protein PCCS19_58570 [Paenibacillus cellulosilyticus]
MKYRVSVNGKRKSRERVSRDRLVERVQAQVEMVEETAIQPEGPPKLDPHMVQQQLFQSYLRIQARSRKRSRTRVAFRMLPPRQQQVLTYTPLKKEIRLPEQLLNRMSLPIISATLPAMKTPKQSVKTLKQPTVQVRSSDRALKRLRQKSVIARSYSRFRMAETPKARKRASSSYQDVYMIFSVRTRRFTSPIRVPPIEQERKEVGYST